ncbi:P-loop containing nucleoside triphosphate hydrolase protein [Xylaria venustula]|nr:P-loop containing nucleoside triphosphate hydrolase protein [Xylaria venustula]
MPSLHEQEMHKLNTKKMRIHYPAWNYLVYPKMVHYWYYVWLKFQSSQIPQHDSVRDHIGLPIFYVVERNEPELIRRWVRYGGDINATHVASGIPLIAFAILQARRPRMQGTEMVTELLKLGASPLVIPAAFYRPYNRDLPNSGPLEADLDDIRNANKLWCKPRLRLLLTSTLSLTRRYRLNQAARAQKISGRRRALAERKNAEALPALYLVIVGQEMAVKSLQDSFLTELARKFGDLLSLELITVGCTMFSREDELFGPKRPYYGYEQGAPINNFLTRISGKRCIVFVDEFEKISTEIWDALLIPFGQGEYVDRRHLTKVDCSKTIWILATNKFYNTIHQFCKTHREDFSENATDQRKFRLFRQLETRLKKERLAHFGAPLSGRISQTVPFLTFLDDEAAIVADKRIMELEAALSRQIKLSSNKEDQNLVVEEVIERPVVGQYLDAGDNFVEDQPITHVKVSVNKENEIEAWVVPMEHRT